MKISEIAAKLSGFTAAKSFIAALQKHGIEIKENASQADIEAALAAKLTATAPAPAADVAQLTADLGTARASITSLTGDRDTHKATAEAATTKLNLLTSALAIHGVKLGADFTAKDVTESFATATNVAAAKLLADNGLRDDALPSTLSGELPKTQAEMVQEYNAITDREQAAAYYAKNLSGSARARAQASRN